MDLIDRNLIGDMVDAHGNVHYEDIMQLPSAQTERDDDLVSRSYLLAEYDRRHKGTSGGARKIIAEAPSAQTDIRSIIKDMAVGEKYLSQWYQNSVMDDSPYWTDEHIKEVLYDFYLIPKQEDEYEQ